MTTLDELRGKARLTRDELQDIYGASATNIGRTATDKAIAVMMEEFKAMVGGSALIGGSPGPLYSAGWASALESVNQLINAMKEEIDHD